MSHPSLPSPSSDDDRPRDDRELLLFHLYGALDPADDAAVRARLEQEPALRDLLDTVRDEAALLATAAQVQADDLEFRAPDISVKRSLLRMAGGLAAAATLLTAVWVGGHQINQRMALARHPELSLTGPLEVPAGKPVSYSLTARDAHGGPVAGDFRAAMRTLDGREVWSGTVSADAQGVAQFDVGADVGATGELLQLAVLAEPAATGRTFATGLLVRTPGELVARVGTDKPLYRPGDVVRLRTVLLDRFRLTPTGRAAYQVVVEDPSGETVFDTADVTERGVGATSFVLDDEAVGGVYTARIEGNDPVLPTAAEFRVRSYRAPRLLFESDLDRDGYGAGESGHLDLSVDRAEGGAPTGASYHARLLLDGSATDEVQGEVPSSGELRIPFSLPKELRATRAALAVRVTDGGTVETHIVPVALRLGRATVTFLPEGGELVPGLTQRVYFEIRDPAGRPTDLRARLVDVMTGEVVADMETVTHGLGRFAFTPSMAGEYHVEADDLRVEGTLVCRRDQGAVLRSTADRHAGVLGFEVASTRAGTHRLVAVCRGTEIAETTVDLSPGRTRSVELTPRHPVGGTVRVTLFDPAGFPAAERLVALTPPHRLDVDVSTPTSEFAPGDTVSVTLRTRDEAGSPAAALLGVRVVDKGVHTLARDDSASFPFHFHYGLEVAELEHVGDFEGQGPDVDRAVDLLLGVQGWRRFSWRDPDQFRGQHPERAGHVLARTQTRDEARPEVPLISASTGAQRWRVRGAVRRFHRGMRSVTAIAVLIAFVLICGNLIRVGRKSGSMAATVTGSGLLGGALALFLAAVLLPNTLGAKLAEVADSAAAPGMAVERATGADWGAPESEELEETLDVGFALRELGRARPDTEARIRDALEELRERQQGDAQNATDFEDTLRAAGFRGLLQLTSRSESFQQFDDTNEALVHFERKLDVPAVVEREYRHRHVSTDDGLRLDFSDVLYWRPLVVTDEQGEATFEFETSDLMTTFRIDVEAHDGRGALATGRHEVTNRLPFFVEPTLPTHLTVGDVLRIPVTTSTLDPNARVELAVQVQGGLVADDAELTARRVQGASAEFFTFRATAPGSAMVIVSARDESGFEDRQVRTVDIVARGYPQSLSVGGAMTTAAAGDLILPDDAYPETVRAELTLYPGRIATLRQALTGMLRMPGGCFEQTSSSNYPNVLALQLLERTGTVDVALARQCREYLDVGYERLTGYECSDGGFEWFGNDPGHPGLTAYGLMQFQAMSEVYDVDAAMIARTRAWLLQLGDADGRFRAPTHALHSWVVTPDVADAYITWALTEVSEPSAADLAPFVARAKALGLRSDDPYVVALAALTLRNREHADADRVLDRLQEFVGDDGSYEGTEHSIVGSTGANLRYETTALAAMALLRAERVEAATKACDWLLSERSAGGTFGSTQATVLSLSALMEYAEVLPPEDATRAIAVRLDGTDVGQVAVATSALTPATLELPRPRLGGTSLIELAGAGEGRLPWSVGVSYRTRVPPSADDCAVRLETRLSSQELRRGETVSLTASVRNVTDAAVPMTLVRIGLPAGLQADTAQLDELRTTGRVAYYEERGQELTLYLNGLDAGETRGLGLDLLAVVPGQFEAPSSRAYLYYTDDQVHWVPPLQVVVTE